MKPTPAVRWFVEAGAPLAPLYRAWNAGAAADVPIGRRWEVVRVTSALGYDVLRRLRSMGAELGPVLDTPARAAVEFIVETGTAASWPPLTGTRAAATGVIRCPPPHMTVPAAVRSTGGRRWIVPPLYLHAADTTDANALCEAVAAALMHRAGVSLALAGRGERR